MKTKQQLTQVDRQIINRLIAEANRLVNEGNEPANYMQVPFTTIQAVAKEFNVTESQVLILFGEHFNL
jgi:hypothetical protein